MHKQERQQLLLSLIASEAINKQWILASRLKDRGYSVTQASISRDLVELGIVKVNGKYSIPSKTPDLTVYRSVVFDTAGPNLIVGRCAAGLASAITVRIDNERFTEIVGTIAGDDTIFIATRDENEQSLALHNLRTLFE